MAIHNCIRTKEAKVPEMAKIMSIIFQIMSEIIFTKSDIVLRIPERKIINRSINTFKVMTIKQLSIFIENKSGTLIRVLDLLSRANIQIIASTIADTQDYGIFRVLCSAPGQAFLILKDNGINVQLADVMAITIDDEPGRAAQAVKALSDAGVNILYMYSFLWKGKGVLTMRTDEVSLAEKVIQENNIQLLDETEFIL